mgnify:CR=1 FL=1
MPSVSLIVVSKEGIVKKEKVGSERVHIEFFEEYQLGDEIVVTIEKSKAYLMYNLWDNFWRNNYLLITSLLFYNYAK